MRAGDSIFVCVLGLLCIGVVMVNSAGLTIDPESAVTFQSIVWSRSTVYMLLAMGALVVASRVPVRTLVEVGRRPSAIAFALLVIYAALACVYLPGIGHEVNGSHRWVRLPGIGQTMQPSELAKWGVLLVLTWYAARRGGELASFFRGLLPALLVVMPIAALIALEDLGTGVLIAASACVVLVASGARLWHLLAFAPIGAAGLAAAVLTSDYRMRRLTAFMNPYSDPEGAGYHMIQSLVAVANGGGPGRGLGFGLQKFGYLPEDRTDFLFAVICEELGIAGAAMVIALLAALLWSGVAVVRRARAPALRLLGLGIVTTFGLQAVMNLMVVTGLAPTKGIALPLLSSGGTGWILTAASFGLLIAIDRAGEREALDTARPAPVPAPRYSPVHTARATAA
ncbi:MAG TPA: hypothetical protein DEB06_08970 [Phycisphaerales bacterium]|nr:hypothetical protein [Phycisphaerales bacterium]